MKVVGITRQGKTKLGQPNGESIIRIIGYGGVDQNFTDRDILNEIQQKNNWYCVKSGV